MLKRRFVLSADVCILPAAFRRLCVETSARKVYEETRTQPPSGGCVLKL